MAFTTSQVVTATDMNALMRGHHSDASTVDIVSSTTETNLYSVSLSSADMGTTGCARITVVGDWLNDTGAGRDLQIKVVLGTTTVFDDNDNVIENAARRPWRLDLLVAAAGSASSQVVNGTFWLGAAGGATTGLGDFIGVSSIYRFVLAGTAAENLAAAKTLAIKGDLDYSSASLSFRKLYALTEIVSV